MCSKTNRRYFNMPRKLDQTPLENTLVFLDFFFLLELFVQVPNTHIVAISAGYVVDYTRKHIHYSVFFSLNIDYRAMQLSKLQVFFKHDNIKKKYSEPRRGVDHYSFWRVTAVAPKYKHLCRANSNFRVHPSYYFSPTVEFGPETTSVNISLVHRSSGAYVE